MEAYLMNNLLDLSVIDVSGRQVLRELGVDSEGNSLSQGSKTAAQIEGSSSNQRCDPAQSCMQTNNSMWRRNHPPQGLGFAAGARGDVMQGEPTTNIESCEIKKRGMGRTCVEPELRTG